MGIQCNGKGTNESDNKHAHMGLCRNPKNNIWACLEEIFSSEKGFRLKKYMIKK